MANSGTFGYIRFNPNLDRSVIEEITTELKVEGLDIEFNHWERRIDIGDPLDFHLIDLIMKTLKTFDVSGYIEDIAFNCNS